MTASAATTYSPHDLPRVHPAPRAVDPLPEVRAYEGGHPSSSGAIPLPDVRAYAGGQPSSGGAMDEAAAQSALVRQHYDRVYQLARSLSRTDEDAEDLTQQALLELLRSLPSFRDEPSVERWVERITVHCARGMIRKERYRRRLLERWLVPGLMPWGIDTEVTVSDPLDLDEALGKLPAERRRMMLLRHALGYTVNEISGLTSTPRGTVKDRLVAGKKQLMRSMRAELMERGWISGTRDTRANSDTEEDWD